MALPFRAFTIKHSGLVNRIITEVGLTPAFDPKAPPSPLPSLVPTSALWDTGATGTALTPSVVSKLGLIPTGMAIVGHAGGSSPSNTYLVNLYLPNNVAIAGVPVTECAETAQFGAIVGMDIICEGDFAVTNVARQTWFSFCVPSIRGIDYVQELNKVVFAGVGRNEPCPCGQRDAQGKRVKFKRCHGR